MAKTGRKPQGEYQNKSVVFSTRIRPDTKIAIQKAAAASGRSLSQEVEYRLVRSLDDDENLFDQFGGRENYSVLRLIGACLDINYNPTTLDATWRDDPYTFDQTVQTIASVLQAFRPEGSGELKEASELMQVASQMQGRQRAAEMLLAVLSSGAPTIDKDGNRNVAAFIKDGLGELTERVEIVRGNAKQLREAAERMEKDEESQK